ncbi:MAG: DUF554 domain-containing protein [Lachnospiraceae bacterium]|nr:DUF554 domain-containing protein [Lachnospiraceae bacterium]
MLGTIVNCAAIICGSLAGKLIGNHFPARTAESIMKILGICTFFIGISGAMNGADTLLVIISLVIGTFLGETLDLDGRVIRFGDNLQKAFQRGQNGSTSLGEGFVNASLLFCIGSMAIMGSLDSGLRGDHSILFNKSLLDMTYALLYSSSMGIGVMLSAISVFIYQGALTFLAGLLSPYLTDAIITNVCCAGSLMIVGIGFNILGLTKLRIMNFMPAILIVIPLTVFFG